MGRRDRVRGVPVLLGGGDRAPGGAVPLPERVRGGEDREHGSPEGRDSLTEQTRHVGQNLNDEASTHSPEVNEAHTVLQGG